MGNRWFITRDRKQRHGPFSDAQLRQLASSGRVLPSDMLWLEGSTQWVPANSIDGLFSQNRDSTKKCRFCAEDIQSAAIVCRYCGRDLTEAGAPQQLGASRLPKYVDYLFVPRLVMLILGIVLIWNPLGWLLLVGWLAMGIVSLSMKAAWRNRQQA
jgi:hypothetical protein